MVTLLCEYTANPFGINNPHPRFSWRVDNGADQVSFSISVKQNGREIWKKNKKSAEPLVTYDGPALTSRTEYTAYVKLNLVDGSKVASAPLKFETALMSADEWKGSYIAFPGYEKRKSPMFLRRFNAGKVVKARAYIIGLGYYELTINGNRIGGNTVLNPGWTDYTMRILYDTYDVTSFINDGENALGVMLGEGWFGHEHEFFLPIFGNTRWYNDPCLRMDLYLTYADGKEEVISTAPDGQWLSAQSPIIMNNVYDGETYDARLEMPGWDTVGFDASAFVPAIAAPKTPTGLPDTTVMPRICEHTPLLPKEIHRPGEYTVTYDFGQNIAGWVQLRLRGPKGAKVVIKYGESLNADRSVNQLNLRKAKATDTYILHGEYVEENYKPRFTYHGFRYAEVTIDAGVHLLGVHAYRVNNALQRTGNFECSDAMINRIYKAIVNTEMNNEHSLPTDCPQRDERLAWINDMTVRWEQTMFNFDAKLFFEKWLNDIADSQTLQDSGAIGDTAPFFYGGFPACHVSSIYVLLPYYVYLFYGDITPLRKHYEGMKKYADFKLSVLDENGLVNSNFFGDWAPPMNESEFGHSCDALPANINKQIITTGYVYYDCRTMATVAKLLNKPEDAKHFAQAAEQAKAAINKTCFDYNAGTYVPASQGSNVFPLFLDIVPKGYEQKVADTLMNDLMITNDCHITTGNQTTKYLFEVLHKLGNDAAGVKLLQKEDYPSFGYMFACGGTTIWERFENSTGVGMNSHNHPMHGSFSVWLYKALAGINPTELAKNGKYTVAPGFDCGLDSVSASCNTPNGLLASCWRKTAAGIELTVTVPWNTTATLDIGSRSAQKDGTAFDTATVLHSGTYSFIIK